MVQHACISIGIDRYQFFQPLSFAGADAQAMVDFFVSEEAWEPEKCLLMTDDSTPINGNSTYPNQQNIEQCLNNWCWEILQPGDFLWFFFSGYGVSVNDNEYLIPLDGDPQAIEQTGISLTKLYRQFNAPGLNVMTFLDVNRSQGSGSHQGFGEVAAQLSQEFNIPTFLSCHSNEFSHEAANLKHGVFTAALIEALRFYPDLSIESLRSHLNSRVPELSEHHWRPVQHPLALVPDDGVIFRPIFSGTTQQSWAPEPPPAPPELVSHQPSGPPPATPTSGYAAVVDRSPIPDAEVLAVYQENQSKSRSQNHPRQSSRKSGAKIWRRTVATGLAGATLFASSLFIRPQYFTGITEQLRNSLQLWQSKQ